LLKTDAILSTNQTKYQQEKVEANRLHE